MMKRTMSFLGVAGCALAAGSLCAASVTNTFDTAEAVGGWTGDCARSTSESNYVFSAASVAGFPTGSKSDPMSGNYVLTVEGTANVTVTGAGNTPLVDMMVQAARPDEELELPSEDEGEVHIAVAVDSEGYFNAYCKTNGSDSGWCKIQSTPTGEDAWVRVSLLFDYEHGRCQIRLNGEPVMSDFGYVQATGNTTGGAWYNLANGSSASSVKVVGCTAIDEYVLNDAGEYPLVAGAKNAEGVSCAWLDQWGLAWNKSAEHYDSSTKTNGTAMTVADKYKYCFSPFDGQGEADFAVKSMATTDSSVTVGVPATVATAGRKVVLESATNEGFTEGKQETTVSPATTTVVVNRIPVPGSVLYFRLRATDDNGNN